MLRISNVARHPAADVIGCGLAAEVPIAAIARACGLTKSAVRRRRDALRPNCLEYLSALATLTDKAS